MKILFVDATVRPGSRTLRLAQTLLARLGGEVEHLRLADAAPAPLSNEKLDWRTECCAQEDFSDPYFDCARALAQADAVVIAAPFWDNSFPAVLKAWIEAVMISGLTFRYDETGMPHGLCRAQKLYYVTTAGGPIFNDAYGYGYVSDLAKTMFGIPETCQIKAEGLDIWGADTEAILRDAEAEIQAL